MSPYSSNTSSSNPNIQQQYAQQQAEQRRAAQQQAEQQRAAQQQAEQQRAAQNPPVGAPPEQAPRMVQRNRQQQDAVRDEMDIDTGDDDVRAPKRKREEAGELMEGEDRAPKKIRLDPPPEAGPDVRLVARGDMAMPVPAIPTAPLTSEALKTAIQSDDLETVIYLLDAGVLMGQGLEEALSDAAAEGSAATVRELLRRGADINAQDNKGYTALMWAACNGNVDAAMVLLDAGASTSAEDSEETPAIVLAVLAGSTALVRALLEHGADIDEPDDNDDMTALMTAANEGEDEIFSLLLNAKADIHLTDGNGLTALAYATLHGSTDMLEQLLKLGADINHRFNLFEFPRTTVLICAVDYENFEKAKLLLAWGADVNIADGSGTSPLMHAVKSGNEELFTLLLRANANIHAADNEGNTALTYAAKKGNVAMVEQLLTLGVNINASNNKGLTALMLAAELGHEKVFNLLIKKRADIHATACHRETALMYAIKGGSEAIVDTLVSLGADIHARTSNGETALTNAIGWGRVEMLRLLLALRVNVNTADHAGKSPLMEAASRGNAEMFRLLLDAGAAIHSINNRGQTVMMHAVVGGNVWIVKTLLDIAPNIDAVDRYGRTALMQAAAFNKLDMLQLLLERGAQVNLRGTHAKNATVTAIEQGNMPALELLLAYGGEPHDMQGTPSPLLGDMRRHRALLKPGFVADTVTLEALYGSSLSSLPHINSNTSVSAELVNIGEAMQICSPIMLLLNEQLHASDKLWQVLAGTGGELSAVQRTSIIVGLLTGLGVWIQSWSPGWNPYQGNNLSTQVEANLVALVKLQVEKLVALGEQMEMTLATSLETLMPQCAEYTQVKNGAPVVEMTGLLAHLTGQLGLYDPLADQVAAAWFTAVNQQQPVITASSLFQSGFDEQASESEAGQVLLAAFGRALKQIDSVAGGSLLRTSALQGQQAGLYADLMFRQLHMLMQFADQASVAS